MIGSGKETVRSGTLAEVFFVFLRLGLVGFGGPAAHLALFRTVFTGERRWLEPAAYDELMALCQFLPGPGSSQTAAAVGWVRAGPLGGVVAMTAFALPSLAIMGLAGWGAVAFAELIGTGLLAGLLAAAAGVVANAVLTMARTQAASVPGAVIAFAAFAVVLFAGGFEWPLTGVQPAMILLGALAGLAFAAAPGPAEEGAVRGGGRRGAIAALVVFAGLLAGLPLVAGEDRALMLADAVYRAGALVFGGGHVVLPLLEAGVVPDLVEEEAFLAGYGLVQAVPGPLFTFSAFIGAAAADGPAQALGYAALAAASIFLPGLLLVYAALPFWAQLKSSAAARRALSGAASAVTGILAAALIDPVIVSVPAEPIAYLIAIAAFLALRFIKAPPPLVVLACGAAGFVLL
ncbi:MAG: chromate efflux transporter [Oceanicaulis sp.]